MKDRKLETFKLESEMERKNSILVDGKLKINPQFSITRTLDLDGKLKNEFDSSPFERNGSFFCLLKLETHCFFPGTRGSHSKSEELGWDSYFSPCHLRRLWTHSSFNLLAQPSRRRASGQRSKSISPGYDIESIQSPTLQWLLDIRLDSNFRNHAQLFNED